MRHSAASEEARIVAALLRMSPEDRARWAAFSQSVLPLHRRLDQAQSRVEKRLDDPLP
jgi:hypothetical protein